MPCRALAEGFNRLPQQNKSSNHRRIHFMPLSAVRQKTAIWQSLPKAEQKFGKDCR